MPKTNVKVKLVGEDGNSFAILSKVSKALRKADHVDLAEEFMSEATRSDYDHLLQTCIKYVEVC